MPTHLRTTIGLTAAALVSGLVVTLAPTVSGSPARAATVDDCRPVVATPPPTTAPPTTAPPTTAPPTTTPPTTAPPTTAPPTTTPPPTPGPPTTPGNYTPVDGDVSMNNPLKPSKVVGNTGDNDRRVNYYKLRDSIRSTPTCGSIRFYSWNMRTSCPASDANCPNIVKDLEQAVDRGVQVQLIMARSNTGAKGTATYNPDYEELKSYLAASNKRLNPILANAGRLNEAKTCGSSCRYFSGAAHYKLYLFSQVGNATGVVFYGSHNLTNAAIYNQWNDLYTVVQPAYYKFMSKIYDEAFAQNRTSNPYRRASFSGMSMDIYAYRGAGRTSGSDPVMTMLNKVRCTNAGAAGVGGRTAIRIVMAAFFDQRAQDLTTKLIKLKRSGCNIRILLAAVNGRTMTRLRSAGVPVRQLGKLQPRTTVFEYYTHMKTMAISGNFGGKSNTKVAINGTANWTASSLGSDELVGTVYRAGVVNAYNNFVNYWYTNTPMGSRWVAAPPQDAGNRVSSPWAKMEQDY